jgi:hypothetical protein
MLNQDFGCKSNGFSMQVEVDRLNVDRNIISNVQLHSQPS